MQTLHTVNIFTHTLFGTLGLLIGLIAILNQNRPQRHSQFGRYFLYSLLVVVATAFVGIFFFRSNPFLLILTLLGGYVGYSGYRVIQLREQRSTLFDLLITVGVLAAGCAYLRSMQLTGGNWAPAVVYPTLSALVLVAGYDLIKWFWLFNQLKTWWLYEHIYKMLSAFSALLSAFSGTVFSHYKPYSQILPSVLCLVAIAYFIGQRARSRKNNSVTSIHTQ